jgi:MoxR-like ATPase
LDVDPRAALAAVEPSLSREDLLRFQAHVASIPAADTVKRSLAELIRRSRPDRLPARFKGCVQLGVSPRGAQALFASAKARAALAGRLHVTEEDVHAMAPPVLRHRILLSFAGRAEGLAADDVVAALLAGG